MRSDPPLNTTIEIFAENAATVPGVGSLRIKDANTTSHVRHQLAGTNFHEPHGPVVLVARTPPLVLVLISQPHALSKKAERGKTGSNHRAS